MKYVVKKGDTLSGIAKAHGIEDWGSLWRRNRGVIGDNPHLIHPGTVLNIPGPNLLERVRKFLRL